VPAAVAVSTTQRGAWTLSFNAIVAVDVKILADYDYYPGNALMGIYNYYQGNVETLVMMDTKRFNKYNSVSKKLDDVTTLKLRFKSGGTTQPQPNDILVGTVSSATAKLIITTLDGGSWANGDAHGTFHVKEKTGTFDASDNFDIQGGASNVATNNEGGDASFNEFTGDDSNFFWFENWKDVGYLTNDKDQLYKYKAGYLTCFNIDLDVEGGPDNDVNTCRMIFVYHSRLLLLRTTERGSSHYRRMRYSQVNSTVFKDDDYQDAPTEDWIMAADFISGVLYVWFERSVWKILYTGDPDLPLRWKKVVDTEGCYATYSLLTFSDEIVGVGPTRFVGTDGRDAYGIDEKIPDFMLEFNQDAVGYCYSLILEEESQGWISYPALGSAKPDNALILNYDADNYATYGLPIHTLGYSSLPSDVLLDDIDEVLDNLDYSFDDKELQAGYPTTLMGCRDGYIYQLNYGGEDNGSAIEFEALSGRWNPHIEEGYKARFGYVEFLVDVDQNVSFNVEFYLDQQTSAYKTLTVTCTGTGEKVWKRLTIGAVGQFHRIRITNNAKNNRPRIHAIVPYFRRAGRII
jgi:hypothetical protein